jgi:hypothetical protein
MRMVSTWKVRIGSLRSRPPGDASLSYACRPYAGACEGVCACSTCHVILQGDVYSRLDVPSEEEDDMLDQAFGLTPT